MCFSEDVGGQDCAGITMLVISTNAKLGKVF
jgi:hypothetical protein